MVCLMSYLGRLSAYFVTYGVRIELDFRQIESALSRLYCNAVEPSNLCFIYLRITGISSEDLWAYSFCCFAINVL